MKKQKWTGSVPMPAAATAARAKEQAMRLCYDEPASCTDTAVHGATKWAAASLPIGNGVLGANVFGETGEELLTINEETLWSGGRGSAASYDGGNPDPEAAKFYYSALADHYINGTPLPEDPYSTGWHRPAVSMENLRGDSRSDSGYDDGYQPLGDLKFRFGHRYDPGSYERSLDLDQGVSRVVYSCGGIAYEREYFASNPDNVIVSRFTAGTPGSLTFTTRFASKQSSQTVTAVDGRTGRITVSGKVANNGLLHCTKIAVAAEGGRVSAEADGIRVDQADSVTVYLTAATDYANVFTNGREGTEKIEYYYRTGETPEALAARVDGMLNAAVRKGYQTVRDAHAADYTALYSRVKLNLGQSSQKYTDELLSAYQNSTASPAEQRYLEVLLFQYGRYLLISGSRYHADPAEGAVSQLPTTLQGLWNDTSGTVWNSDIHTNINLEMNYWLSGSCNLAECAMPLVNYMAKLAEPGGRTVETYTGCPHGIMAHTQNTPFGLTAPGWEIGTWGWSPAAATWLMQNCYDYFRYSQDARTLRSTIYPMMKEQVLMYEQLLQVKDGRKVMPIALSPEVGPVTSGNTFEQSLIWQLYADTIEAARYLGEEVPKAWRDTMEMLRPIEIGDSGQIKEWYHETTINSVADTSGHRHLSNLLGLFPGDAIDTEAERKAAKVSLNNKNFGKVGATGQNPEGGWTYGQMIPSWARVGEGDNAYFCVNQMIKTRLFENLWDFHNDAIFQIDGNYGYSAGVAEMLVQSNLGYIDLLPAISRAWAEGNVSGLLTEGGVEVAMTWSDAQVTAATLTPRHDGTILVRNPFAGMDLEINGRVVPCDENGIACAAVTAGETYTLGARQPQD